MREILVRWSTLAGGGFVSVMNFEDAGTVATQRSDLNDLLTACSLHLSTSTEWVIDTSGVERDDVTGALTGAWSEGTVYEGDGGASGQVADATQGLLRWNTGVVVDGRFLKGRTFLPGLAAASITAGNLSVAARNAFLTAAATFVAGLSGFGVWHRPVGGAGGSFEVATSADVWSEAAVLRDRRA